MSEMLKIFLSEEQMKRFRFVVTKNGAKAVVVDLHGLKAKEARTFIKNAVAANREGLLMYIVHGFNHGTAIKDIVNSEKISERIIERHLQEHNPGCTILSVGVA
jgi:hypothetical protein